MYKDERQIEKTSRVSILESVDALVFSGGDEDDDGEDLSSVETPHTIQSQWQDTVSPLKQPITAQQKSNRVIMCRLYGYHPIDSLKHTMRIYTVINVAKITFSEY